MRGARQIYLLRIVAGDGNLFSLGSFMVLYGLREGHRAAVKKVLQDQQDKAQVDEKGHI
jgi:hypothetical protein